MSDCIEWTGAKAGNGYGVTSRNGRQVYVHRVAAEQHFGPIPAGMVVAHKCDNPACHNPEHLAICTQRENLQDMREKGRHPHGDDHWSRRLTDRVSRGEKVGSSKLTADLVRQIRAEYQPARPGSTSPTSLTGIAKKYGIAFQTVSKIINRKTWGHV